METKRTLFQTNFGESESSVVLIVEEDGIELPVTSLVMSYAINEVPTASVTLPLGFGVDNKPSLAYKRFEGENTLKRAKVLFKVPPREVDESDEFVFKSGNFLLFVGYITGYSHRRHIQNLSLVVSLKNSLIGLTMSSAASTDVLPGTPDNLLQSSENPGAGLNSTWVDQFTSGLGARLIGDYGAILGLLKNIAENTDILPRLDGVAAVGNKSNKRAVEALSGDAKLVWKGFNQGTEYPLVVAPPIYTMVEAFIRHQLTTFKNSFSFWDILVSKINPHFGVQVIPTASEAFLAPVVNLAKEPHLTLTTRELSDINLSSSVLKPLRGAIVYGKYTLSTLTETGDGRLAAKYAYIAYQEDDISNFLLFLPFPQWWQLSSSGLQRSTPTPHDIITLPINTGANWPVQPPPIGVRWDPKETLENYAKYIYGTEVLRGRSGTLISRLRFDVCPGMTIKIEATDRVGDNPEIDLVSDSYGLVNRVTTTINSQEMTAITYMELSEIRSEKENNETNRFSMEEHPFFGEKFFKGESLVTGITN